MSAKEAIKEMPLDMAGYKVRYVLNKMYKAGQIGFHEYWEAVEYTMEVVK